MQVQCTFLMPYSVSSPQSLLLSYRCPYRDDNYMTRLLAVGASSEVFYPAHYRRFVFKMFTFVGQGAANPSKKSPANPDVMVPLNEKVQDPNILEKIFCCIVFLNLYLHICKQCPLFFTRCLSTAMQLCASLLLEIIVNLGASERVSCTVFTSMIHMPPLWSLSIFPLFSTKMNTEYSLLDNYFEVLYRNSMWHENLEKLNIFSLKE